MTAIEENTMRTVIRTLPIIAKSLEDISESLSHKNVCCICGNEFSEHPNNAFPVKEGICCDKCNWTVVLESRIKLSKGM